MGIKKLFTVPDGEIVTEKALRRVLISSICSILLCMTCLVSTTWAWFAVSIENTGNVIQIVEPKINLTVDSFPYESGEGLSTGTHTVNIVHANEEDDFREKSTLYVTLTISCDNGTITVYTILNHDNHYETEITVNNNTGNSCKLSWEVSWFAPVNAVALTDSTVTLNTENTTESTTESAGDIDAVE